MKKLNDKSIKSKFSWINRRVILWTIIGLLIVILIDLSLRNPISASQAVNLASKGSGMVGGC